jgi:hypothetical protein
MMQLESRASGTMVRPRVRRSRGSGLAEGELNMRDHWKLNREHLSTNNIKS